MMSDAATVLKDLPLPIASSNRFRTPTRASHSDHVALQGTFEVVDLHVGMKPFWLESLTVSPPRDFGLVFVDCGKVTNPPDRFRGGCDLLVALEKEIFTGIAEFGETFHKLTVPMTPTPELARRGAGAESALQRAFKRLAYLLSLPDGWLGAGSSAASAEAAEYASLLLNQIHDIAPAALPDLSLEDTGTIVMSWDDNGLSGNLSIRRDGSYAYFVERDGGDWASDGKASVQADLAPKLAKILAA